MRVGDILTLNQDIIVAYDHSMSSTKLTKGDKLTLVSISPNNPNFLRLKKEGISNNIGLTIDKFK